MLLCLLPLAKRGRAFSKWQIAKRRTSSNCAFSRRCSELACNKHANIAWLKKEYEKGAHQLHFLDSRNRIWNSKPFLFPFSGGVPVTRLLSIPSSSSRNCHPRRRSMSQPNEQALPPIFLSFYQCLLACLESRPPVIAIFRLWLLSKAGGPCLQGPTPILISFFIPPSSPFAHGKDREGKKEEKEAVVPEIGNGPAKQKIPAKPPS